jgi:hypothetical protein
MRKRPHRGRVELVWDEGWSDCFHALTASPEARSQHIANRALMLISSAGTRRQLLNARVRGWLELVAIFAGRKENGARKGAPR